MSREYPRRIQKAFDEIRFSPSRTLNLRESLPTADEARVRAENWIRAKQVERAGELLIITGRGKGSEGGVPVIRQAILALLPSLRRRNVITGWEEHTAGSFVVTLASMSALFEAPKRRREPTLAAPVPESLSALTPETLKLLRELAVASLMLLGVHDSERFIESEMTDKFSKLTAVVSGAEDPEMELRAAIRHALDELDETE
ncbi:MAG TPA: Smr/MutS family protein [Gemmatimonadaceae bacterium]